jgi:hypothetical protein
VSARQQVRCSFVETVVFHGDPGSAVQICTRGIGRVDRKAEFDSEPVRFGSRSLLAS